MKKKFPCLCGCMLAFLLFSCQTTETNEIDLSKPAGTITQKFSDMADNLRAIPLETSDSCLLSSNLGVWVGNKYIITADRESMHLFDKDGKHIRQLAKQGKGPGEFNSIATFTVDEAEERLYYRDWSQRTELRVIELNTGKNTGKISNECNDLVNLTMTQNHSLTGNSHTGIGTSKQNYEVVTLSDTGELLSYVVTDTTSIDKAKNIFKPYLCKTGNRISYWNPNTDHILFEIKDSLKIPQLVFKLNNPFTYQKRQGNFLRIKAETNNEVMIQIHEYNIFAEEEGLFGVGVSQNSKAYNYRIGKNDRAVYLIEQFDNDLLGEVSSDFPTLTSTNGNHIFLQKSTQQIKQLAEEQLKAGKELTPTLKELNERLKDDDNPVIITGTFK